MKQLDIGGRRIVPGHTVVAYYGAPGGTALGVLGQRGPAAEWSHVVAAARPFGASQRPAVPAYELIADVEQGSPGPHHNYVGHESAAVIRSYLRVVNRRRGLLILDIQPGRDDFLPLARQLRPWLLYPNVSLGLDPEWKLAAGQKPDKQIGRTDAASINAVSGWLDRFTAAHRLPQKLLVIHQFTAHEIGNKHQVRRRRHLALVFNMDGFGPPSLKLNSYRIVAKDRQFPLGFKLFYRQDTSMLSPRAVLRLHPRPVLVEYE